MTPSEQGWDIIIKSMGNQAKQPSMKIGRVTVGHPVDVASGIVYTAWDDFEIFGSTACAWRRFYSTAYVEASPLGRGWMSPYLIYLTRLPDGIALRDHEAREILFPTVDKGETRLNVGNQMQLQLIG